MSLLQDLQNLFLEKPAGNLCFVTLPVLAVSLGQPGCHLTSDMGGYFGEFPLQLGILKLENNPCKAKIKIFSRRECTAADGAHGADIKGPAYFFFREEFYIFRFALTVDGIGNIDPADFLFVESVNRIKGRGEYWIGHPDNTFSAYVRLAQRRP
jgi:hypothetical protein